MFAACSRRVTALSDIDLSRSRLISAMISNTDNILFLLLINFIRLSPAWEAIRDGSDQAPYFLISSNSVTTNLNFLNKITRGEAYPMKRDN